MAAEIAAAPDMLEELRQTARELETVARRLNSGVRPGHVEYLSKEEAAMWLAALVRRQRAAIAKALGES